MITGKLYGGLNAIGEAILLKELSDDKVMIMVLELPPPIEDMREDLKHGCGTTVWKVAKGDEAQEDTLVYVPNAE